MVSVSCWTTMPLTFIASIGIFSTSEWTVRSTKGTSGK